MIFNVLNTKIILLDLADNIVPISTLNKPIIDILPNTSSSIVPVITSLPEPEKKDEESSESSEVIALDTTFSIDQWAKDWSIKTLSKVDEEKELSKKIEETEEVILSKPPQKSRKRRETAPEPFGSSSRPVTEEQTPPPKTRKEKSRN